MAQFSKARWTTDGDTVRLGVEFSKVNKQKRLVSGWATLDNVDTEGDVVTAEASLDAFSRARGNLREMHKKDSAVGRVVNFKQDTFRAPDGSIHKGIFVTARVSEGAEDTWLKVLDGTLNGFSIGGSIVDSEEDWTKDGSQKIRKVTKFDLSELSLVDNPGNQYADVVRIQKSADGSVTSVTGMVEEQKILNVFFCDDDKISKESPADFYTCPICDEKMEIIGFIEDTGSDRDSKVNTLVTKYLSHEDTEGGDVMAKGKLKFTQILKSAPADKEETVDTGHEAGDPTEVPTPAVPADEVDEVDDTSDSEEVSEVHDDDEEITKKIDELKGVVADILSKNRDETAQKIEALEKSIKEMGEAVDKKVSELGTRLTELDTNLGKARNRLSGLEKTLEKVNSSAALKKSADLNDDAEQVQNDDPWANSAFSVHGLFE